MGLERVKNVAEIKVGAIKLIALTEILVPMSTKEANFLILKAEQ